jgi:hypothetical protein
MHHRFRHVGPAQRFLPLLLSLAVCSTTAGAEGRPPRNDEQLKRWLTSMVGYHRFSIGEVTAATGLPAGEVQEALRRLEIAPGMPLPETGTLVVLPYPGGRHPRIGFLEGAIDPQRETKVSVFTPWHDPAAERADYVVVDAPEAVWSNLGLTYLAHTHVPTIWSQQGIAMERLEWERHDGGSLSHSRMLPNGIRFTSSIHPRSDHVRMRMQLTNGTDQTLTGLRVQMCAMLKGAAGFDEQTSDNKVFKAPYAAVHDEQRRRWILMAWLPNQRTWGNERCPCLHSDPQFPDCPPGEMRTVDGWLSFYEGEDIAAEIERIDRTDWWTQAP